MNLRVPQVESRFVAGRLLTFRDASGPDRRQVTDLADQFGLLELVDGAQLAVAIDGDLVVGYVAFRDGPPGWDVEVRAVGTHPDYRDLGIYHDLNVWIVQDAPDDLTICAFVNDDITEHVVTTQWRPHVARVCENGSRFYGTRKSQVEA